MRSVISLLLGVVALAAAGCSTMASYESIAFESDPSGADVEVLCGATRVTAVTPGHVVIPRKSPDCIVTIRKEGYRDERLWLTSNAEEALWVDTLALAVAGGGVLITSSTGGGIDGEVAAEVMISGLIPWIVNWSTCGSCSHDPQAMKVVLRPRPARGAD